jgi:acetyl/propionyl-CoA carboxylase alpha subunit
VLQAAAHQRLAMEGGSAGDPWRALSGFRLNAPSRVEVRLQADGQVYPIAVSTDRSVLPAVVADDETILVFCDGEAFAFTEPKPDLGAAQAGGGQLSAPMPGRIVQVSGKAGDIVVKGQALVTLEAMKMEHALTAPFDGTIAELTVQVGDQVSEGKILARIEPALAMAAS